MDWFRRLFGKPAAKPATPEAPVAKAGSATFDVPGLGIVTQHDQFEDWYVSGPVVIPMLGPEPRRLVLEGYAEETQKDDFHTAIANLLTRDVSVLHAASEPLYRYYKDFEDFWLEEEDVTPLPSGPALWSHVRLGQEAAVTRRPYGDHAVYVSIECECDWEPEHGLQLVLRNGLVVNKLGGYDGHLTYGDSYANPRLENVIYPSRDSDR